MKWPWNIINAIDKTTIEAPNKTANVFAKKNKKEWWKYLCVKAHSACKRLSAVRGDSHILAGFYLTDIAREVNGITFMTSQSKCICILTGFETKWNNSHPHQITAMDSLKTFSNHCFNTLLHAKSLFNHISDQNHKWNSRNHLKHCIKQLTSNIGPLAAQSLELPLPYSAPAKTMVSCPADLYF